MPELYTHLKEFIREAICGRHTPEECEAILDQIGYGVGLDEHEKAMAAHLQEYGDTQPATDLNPAYSKGIAEGFVQGFKEGQSAGFKEGLAAKKEELRSIIE